MTSPVVTNGHCSLQLAATCDSLRDALRWLEIYYAYTKITRQACSYRQNRRKDAERSMVKTATDPNNTYSSRDAGCTHIWYATVKLYDKIAIQNKQKQKVWKSKKILHKSPSKRWFRNSIHSLLSRADARGSADKFVVCDSYRYFAGQPLLMTSQSIGHAKNI